MEQDIVCKTKQRKLQFIKILFVPMPLFVSTRGGAELLFDGVKEHHVTLPSQSEPCKFNTATGPTMNFSSINDLG